MTELAINLNLPYVERTQRPTEKLYHPIDWTGYLSNSWRPGADFASNFLIRPAKATGFQYRWSGGTTAYLEPKWPTVIDPTLGIVQDGSGVWTCEAVTTQSLSSTVGSSAWSADSPIVVTSASFAGQVTTALIDTTSAVVGTDLYVRNTVTLGNGEIKTGTILLKVRLGL